jgi:hypothetical protein
MEIFVFVKMGRGEQSNASHDECSSSSSAFCFHPTWQSCGLETSAIKILYGTPTSPHETQKRKEKNFALKQNEKRWKILS